MENSYSLCWKENCVISISGLNIFQSPYNQWVITGKNLFDPVSKVQTHELSHGQLFLCADCFWMRLTILAFFRVNLKNISLTSYCVYILPKLWSHYIFEKRRKVKKSNQKIVKWNLELGTNSDDENLTKEKDMKTFKSDFCNFTT